MRTHRPPRKEAKAALTPALAALGCVDACDRAVVLMAVLPRVREELVDDHRHDEEDADGDVAVEGLNA